MVKVALSYKQVSRSGSQSVYHPPSLQSDTRDGDGDHDGDDLEALFGEIDEDVALYSLERVRTFRFLEASGPKETLKNERRKKRIKLARFN